MDQIGKDLIIGYDARECWSTPEKTWTKQRRNSLLIRLDVVRPLSIDQTVWNSVFDYFPNLKPSWVGYFQDLWGSLENLRKVVLESKELEAKQFYIVAFSLCSAFCSSVDIAKIVTLLNGVNTDGETGSQPIVTPSSPGKNWTSLGFDVADLFGTSALSNCGFEEEAVDRDSRKSWEREINEVHLFSDASAAVRFRDFSNSRVPEHAPFFVFQLWRVLD